MTATIQGLTGIGCNKDYSIAPLQSCGGIVQGVNPTGTGTITLNEGVIYAKVQRDGVDYVVPVIIESPVSVFVGNSVTLYVCIPQSYIDSPTSIPESAEPTFTTDNSSGFCTEILTTDATGLVATTNGAGINLGCTDCIKCVDGVLQLPDTNITGDLNVTGDVGITGTLDLTNTTVTNLTIDASELEVQQTKICNITLPSLPAGSAISLDGGTYSATDPTNCDSLDCFVGFIDADGCLITSGVYCGFSGLTVGSDYYLSGSTGGISNTPNDCNKKIGKALSPTCLLIDKAQNQDTDVVLVNGTATLDPEIITIPHNLGVVPKVIEFDIMGIRQSNPGYTYIHTDWIEGTSNIVQNQIASNSVFTQQITNGIVGYIYEGDGFDNYTIYLTSVTDTALEIQMFENGAGVPSVDYAMKIKLIS